MIDSCIYLDTYILQQDMRVRMPKAILSNMGVEKGKTKFDIYLDSRDNSLVFRIHNDNSKGATENAPSDWVVDYHKGLMDGTIVPEFKEAPKRLRRITIKEAARIQSFPDNYVFCGNKGMVYTQIGNAVPCKMAEAVAKAVVEYIRKETALE